MRIRRTLAVAAVAAALATGLTAAPASADTHLNGDTRAAANCAMWSEPDISDGFGNTVSGKQTPLRPSGPYSECKITRYLPSSSVFEVNCYHNNTVGNEWFYITSSYGSGWVYSGNVSVWGTIYNC